ncbi:MAG: DUF86 domain-containing protein [Acidimicrobiia bacterium]|nr:DUF86 domain-containing protein [Acidimicrobiia bacterium]
MGDVLRASRRLQEIGHVGRAAFDGSWVLQDAAVRELEIVGEALNGLSDQFKARVSGLPVDAARGMRNHAAHRYWTLDLGTIWKTIENDIGPLIALLEGESDPPVRGQSAFDEEANELELGVLDTLVPQPPPKQCGKTVRAANKPCLLRPGHRGRCRSVLG